MNNPDIKAFINKHSSLFWYTPEEQKENISEEFLVETILNYGDIKAVKQLITIVGPDRLAEIFSGLEGRKKLNYYPEIYHFFSILVTKNVHSNI
jgi:hypothetical protein